MADTYWGDAVRTVGFVYGLISTLGGVAVFVLFVRIPNDLLYLLPPGVARGIVNVAPWLVAVGRPSGAELLGPLLISVVFVAFGLWSLNKALFGSIGSLSDSIGIGFRNDGD